jgi:quinol monooxygenase YgiN
MEELLVKIRARDDKRFELLRTCKFISDQTLQENGCINSYLSQDNDNDNIIILKQQWTKRSFLNDYFRSDHFSALLGAMKWLGQSYEIRINESSGTEGIQAVQDARAKENVNDE